MHERETLAVADRLLCCRSSLRRRGGSGPAFDVLLVRGHGDHEWLPGERLADARESQLRAGFRLARHRRLELQCEFRGSFIGNRDKQLLGALLYEIPG